MSNPEDYAVGWICAISTEYVAAQSLLDEKHGTPSSVARHDNNDYTLGRIGEHNVVIAVLPDGEYGIASAASVARDMLHSFPNVRIGLMVGIGGGAPSLSHDIRLGDVVVSAPRDGMGGVFQYDFGKTIQNQSFQTTGFLNQPPMVLRTAMAGLRSQYESEGHQLDATIRDALDKRPRLRKKYSRPAQTSDTLYQSNIVHPMDSMGTCNIVCGDDIWKLVSRHTREEDEDNPAIHYGLIASANQLMKDAVMRDTLAAEMGVLCFEMEAAGLMNQFPCLVIRGVCDYSDSHKNKEWQGYAAMTAAAYAKDLLCRIPPNKVEAEQKIKDALSHVISKIDYMKSEWDRKEDLEILDWVTPLNYGPQHSDFFNRRQPGTGQWLLDSAEYKSWLTESNKTLFCAGIPGSGKTILTAIVVEDHEQGIEDLIASLVKQLSRQRPCLPDVIKELHDRHKEEKTRPSVDDLVGVLRSVAALYSRVVIAIDALDECVVFDRSRLRLLRYISSLRTHAQVGLFATSRHIPDVEKAFEGSLRREVLASEEDLHRYLEAHMEQLPGFLSDMDDLKQEIEKDLIQAAQGMFLLVHLSLESLKGTTSKPEVKATLKRLRSRKHEGTGQDGLQAALEQAYDEAMDRIDRQSPDQQRLGRNALEWITCAKRPLSQLELQHALAVEPGDTAFDPDNLREVDSIISLCAGLVTIDEESNVVRLVHYTTQERTLLSRAITQSDDSHSNDGIIRLLIEKGGRIARPEEDMPLYEAAQCRHEKVAELLWKEDNNFTRLLGFVELVDEKSARGALNVRNAQPYQGHARVVDVVLGQVLTISEPILRQRLLFLAARHGRMEVVQLLLQQGVSIQSRDWQSRTALSYAALGGHEAPIRLLLEGGLKIDAKDGNGQTPLSLAADSFENCRAAIELLLDEGAEIDARDDTGSTPLMRACAACKCDDRDRAVGLPFDMHVAVEVGSPPCRQACEWDRTTDDRYGMIESLLDRGAAIEARDKDGQTALMKAAHAPYVRLLLDRGAIIEATDDSGMTALMHAVREPRLDVVEELLGRGAAVHPKAKDGKTALLHVPIDSMMPYLSRDEDTAWSLLERLIKNGAFVDDRDDSGKTLLMEITRKGDAPGIGFLLDQGADIEARDGLEQTALLHAAREGGSDVVQELLDRGAAIEAKDYLGQTALMHACYGSDLGLDLECLQILLDGGAAVNARDNDGKTALMHAAIGTPNCSAASAAVATLLKRGAALKARDNRRRTALSYAIRHRKKPTIVQLLRANRKRGI
ncbi:hypothetical protein TgHK011_000407 [Trichoderma gracile]|nr:hypothetical protein TgHK011_000407 [Trichoderma gracile]